MGGGTAIGPTGPLERAGSAAGVHPLPPRPGRVMWLDQHRPHYVCHFQFSESIDCNLAAYMYVCLCAIPGTQHPGQK